MEANEVKGAVDALNRAFEEFKQTNDTRLKEIEAKRVADPLLEAKLAKIEADMAKSDEMLSKHFGDLQAKVNKLALPAADGLSDEDRAYKQAMTGYIRKGRVSDALEAKSMSVGSDPNGGYFVSPDVSGRIVKRMFETSPMRQICSVQIVSSDALEGLLDKDEAAASWVAEKGTRSESTTPVINRWRIPVHELYAMPGATQQLLDDANVDVEAWLADKVADKFSRTEATAFVTGNGSGKPRGFASYSTVTTADSSRAWGTFQHVASGTQASLGSNQNGTDKLIDLVATLNPIYLPNARFAAPRSIVAEIRKIKSTNGYIWQPSMSATDPATIMGYPYSLLEDMVGITTSTDTLSLAFGDFRAAYQIVDRLGVRTLRDPFTSKPYVLFYTTKRVGGDVIDFNAIKFLKLAAS